MQILSLERQLNDSCLHGYHMLKAAVDRRDLKSPPNNHLEALEGDLVGFPSLRSTANGALSFDGMAPKRSKCV
jgi:plasmid maintenance system killer protein